MPYAPNCSMSIRGRARENVARLVAEARAGAQVEPVEALVQRNVEFKSIAGARQNGWASHLRSSGNHRWTEDHRPTGRPFAISDGVQV
jgi:hypothetical protein